MADHRIDSATPADFNELCGLLKAAHLATDDLNPGHLLHFLIARQGTAAAGGVGIEIHGDAGLLRSLVVAESAREIGIGARLIDAAEKLARQRGLRILYLLTTSAETFFADRGYQLTPRTEAPPAIAGTQQFSTLCPSSSAFMSKSL